MFKLLKIEGDSMYPLLKNGDKILCLSRLLLPLKENDIVVFNHPKEGLMIKQLTKINWQGYYVEGTTPYSIDSSIFGYLEKKEILYKMIHKF